MITYLVVAIVGMAAMAVLGFLVGKRNGDGGISKERQTILEERIGELTAETARQTDVIAQQTEDIKNLTSERDVQKVNVDNLLGQLSEMKAYHDRQMTDVKVNHEREIAELKVSQEKQMENEKAVHDIQLQELRNLYARQFEEQKETSRIQLKEVKENSEKQLATLREMNQKQVEDQSALIKEQMRTTSEAVLKARQEELGMKNKEQVSSIVDPLQKSLKDMEEALNKSKEQQKEALTRLDETIRLNMEKSATLGETADRLTRALTGEVKVQGNFGELKLRQLLEDLELREGEQYDTQETLRDKAGKNAKGDDGKGLVPDFILHFPNNRHVVVDSKMSLTDYERYMNAADDNPQKSLFLKSHIDSVRAQVKRLARKEYTKYLPEGYNRLNFAIMYIPIEGALNLALLNDTSLWREAYDQGIMILGPQTMYMNLRVLEMMWTQVRQLKNQQVMIDAANMVIERVQDFGMRFMDVESSMNDAVKKITKLKITTSESGQSIITAAKKLLKAGARENRKKKTLDEMDESIFIDADPTVLLDVSPDNKPPEGNDSLSESER